MAWLAVGPQLWHLNIYLFDCFYIYQPQKMWSQRGESSVLRRQRKEVEGKSQNHKSQITKAQRQEVEGKSQNGNEPKLHRPHPAPWARRIGSTELVQFQPAWGPSSQDQSSVETLNRASSQLSLSNAPKMHFIQIQEVRLYVK